MKSALRAIGMVLTACLIGTFCVAQTPQENAWTVLNGGLTNNAWEKQRTQ